MRKLTKSLFFIMLLCLTLSIAFACKKKNDPTSSESASEIESVLESESASESLSESQSASESKTESESESASEPESESEIESPSESVSESESESVSESESESVSESESESASESDSESIGEAHVCDYVETVETVAATCVDAGYVLKRCSCGETKKTILSANGHDWSQATCSEASRCLNDGCNAVNGNALSHNMVKSGDESVEPTCSQAGRYVYYCANEGCSRSETETKAKLAHSFGEWTESSSTNEGLANKCRTVVYQATCSECGEPGTKTDVLTEHEFSSRISRNATCSTAGEITKTCSCGYSTTENFSDATAHDYVLSEDGKSRNCSCGAKQLVSTDGKVGASDLVSAGSLSVGGSDITLSDEAKGVLSGKTNVEVGADRLEGEDLQEALAALNNENVAFTGDAPVYNFTMTADGTQITRFGGKITVRIPYELGEYDDPNDIIVWYIGPNGLEQIHAIYSNGFAVFETEHFSYYTVTRMTAEQRCQKFGHEYTTITQEATCVTSGFVYKRCLRCGDEEKTDVPALGHDYTSVKVDATCVTNGSITYSCGTCGETYVAAIFAVGHDYKLVSEEKATCSKSGKADYKCSVCDDSYSVTLPQLNHSLKSTIVSATCETDGYTVYKCVHCDYEQKTDVVKALGHAVVGTVVDPTCVADGYTVKTCSRCEKDLGREAGEGRLGHDMVNGVCSRCGDGCEHDYAFVEKVDSTCVDKGYDYYRCSKCGVSEKRNEVAANGHNYGADLCCVDCGKASPEKNSYYINLVSSAAKAMKYGVKFTNFSLSVKNVESIYRLDDDTTPVWTSVSDNGSFIQGANVMEIYFFIAEDGEIGGYGVVEFDMIQDGESYGGTCVVVVKDGYIYLVMDADETDSQYGPEDMIARLSFECMFGGGDFDYDALKRVLVWMSADLASITDKILETNSTLVANVAGYFVNALFDKEETEDGIAYTLDLGNLKKVVELITDETKKADDFYDAIMGEGSFDRTVTLIDSLIDMTAPQAIKTLRKYGVDMDMICSAIDSFGRINGQNFNAAASVEQMLAQLGDATIGELICAAFGEEAGLTVDGIKAYVDDFATMFRTYGIGEMIIQSISSPDAQITLQELSGQLKAAIDQLSEANPAAISFKTDVDGNLLEVVVALSESSFNAGGSSYGDYWEEEGGVRPITKYESATTVTVSGMLTATFGEDKDLSAYDETIDRIDSLAPRFGIEQAVVIENSEGSESPDENGVVCSESSSVATLYTDANGNVSKIERTHVYLNRGIRMSNGTYVVYNEYKEESTIAYNMIDGAYLLNADACGDWKSYGLFAMREDKGVVTLTTLRYRRTANGTYVLESSSVESTERRDGIYRSTTISVWTNGSSISTSSPHVWELVDKNEVCGGYRIYKCADCEKVQTYAIDHVGSTHSEYELLLKGSEYSCLDGVLVKGVCDECDQVVYEYVSRDHRYGSECETTYEAIDGNCENGVIATRVCPTCSKVIGSYYGGSGHWASNVSHAYDLTEYGSKCGGYLVVRTCPCGQRIECEVEEYYGDDKPGYVCEFDRSEIDCWVNDANLIDDMNQDQIDGWNHLEYNRFQMFTCSVTETHETGEPCGFKIRYANYWSKDPDACVAKRYAVYQLGYTETMNDDGSITSSYALEVKVVLRERVWHDYKELTEEERKEGYALLCSDCGSYEKRSTINYSDGSYKTTTERYNAVDTSKARTYTLSALYENGEMVKYIETTEYYDGTSRVETETYRYDSNGNEVYYRREVVDRDGSTSWYEDETILSEYADATTFGKPVTVVVEIRTTSDSDGRYETKEFGYVWIDQLFDLDSNDCCHDDCYYSEVRVDEMGIEHIELYYWEYSSERYYPVYEESNGVRVQYVYGEGFCLYDEVVTVNGEILEGADYLVEYLWRKEFIENWGWSEDKYRKRVEEYMQEYGDYWMQEFAGNFDLPLEAEEKNRYTTYHHYVYDATRSTYATCTQDGVGVYVCACCGDVLERARGANGHSWGYSGGDKYTCWDCGLENVNGADGAVIFEDLTGDDEENFVIGFYDKSEEGFSVYVSFVLVSASEDENNEVILSDFNCVIDEDGRRVILLSKADLAQKAVDLGLEEGTFDVRLTFVPNTSGDDLDYAITLTTSSVSNENADSIA